MISRDIEAGKAFVTTFVKNGGLATGLIESRRLILDFARFAEDSLNNISPEKVLQRVGAAISGFGKMNLFRGGAIAAAFVPIVNQASRAQETINKFRAVYGEMAGDVSSWIDQIAQRVGRSRTDIRDSISAYQAFFVGLGFGKQKSADLSKEMQALAIDFGSFFNKSDPESNQRFLSALSGSSEVMDQFGVNLKIAALEAEASAQGINKAFADISEPEKVMLRVSLIRKALQSQGAIGDAQRTAGSFENLKKRIVGFLKDTAASIGNSLLPVLEPLAKRLADIIQRFGQWAKNNQTFIRGLAETALKLAVAGVGLMAMGKALSLLGSGFGAAVFLAKWGLIYRLVVPLLPMLFTMASYLRLGSIAATGAGLAVRGFGMGLSYVMGPILRVTALLGALQLGLMALGAVWVNAKLQGITFGESVLDLTHRLTGLSNAFTDQRDAAKAAKEAYLDTGGSAYNARLERGAGYVGTKEDMDAQRTALANIEARKATARKEIERLQNAKPNQSGGVGGGIDFLNMTPGQMDAAIRKQKSDLMILENARRDVQNALEQGAAASEWRAGRRGLQALIPSSVSQTAKALGFDPAKLIAEPRKALETMATNARRLGLATGQQYAKGFQEAFVKTLDQWDDLKRLQIEGMTDPRARDVAMVNLDYAAKMRDAKAAGLATAPVEMQRAQALKNINERYDREAAEKRVDFEKQTQSEIERLRIETSMRGHEKDKALLRMRQREELEAAKRIGADMAAIRQKHQLETQQLAQDSPQSRISAAGTFNPYAVSGLVSGPGERTARNTERLVAQTEELKKLDKQMVDGLRTLKLQFTA